MGMTGSQILEIVVQGVESNQAINNVFHFKQDPSNAPGTLLDLTQALTAFQNRWQAKIIPNATQQYSVYLYQASVITGRQLSPTRPGVNILTYGEQAIVMGGAGDVGALLTDPGPSFEAAGVRWVAQNRGRAFRGGSRLRIGVENQASENKWLALALASLQLAANGLLTPYVAAIGPPAVGFDIGTFGRQSFLKAPGNPVLLDYFSAWTSAIVNPYVTSQVSRKQRQRFQ